MRSSDRMRLGMTYMSELAVFPDLSIEENIRVGAQALGHADPGARVEELYGVFPALREKRRAPASSLSGGQRKMLGIAKALAAEPRLLVMDEPSAGLSPLFVKEVIRILSDLRGRGLGAFDRRAEYRLPRSGDAGIRAGRRAYPVLRHGRGNDRQRSAAARLFRTEVMRTIRIGSGAGYSGDRIEPAVELAEKGDIQYLVFECLGERTVALAQQARMKNPESGYDPLLEERMRAVLPLCAAKGIKIVTNMGAANPLAAARKTAEIAKSLGLSSLKIAAVVGDDVLDACKDGDLPIMEFDGTIKQLGNRLLSANAYLGAEPMAQALSGGADVVITGRASDPALFLAPMIHAFGWAMDDWNLLGQGTVAGHLLECAGQITGGYFADPGYKDVQGLARLGFPIGEVGEDGSLVITKVAGSGGAVTAQTCKEQLLYEVHDPRQYIQPDVVADFSQVKVEEIAPDRVRVSGGRGTKRTDTLKVSVGYVDSFIGEGQISYAGPGALARGRLALEIVRERLKLTGVAASELRFELIGVDSLHGAEVSAHANEPYEVRVRVAGRTENLREAIRIGNEVETLYTNGPAAGGGAFKSARDVVAVASVLLPRELAKPSVQFVGA